MLLGLAAGVAHGTTDPTERCAAVATGFWSLVVFILYTFVIVSLTGCATCRILYDASCNGLGALFAALWIRRQDGEHDAAVGGQAVDDAAMATREVVNDVADARAGLPAPSADPTDLAREPRTEGTAASPSRRRCPF